MFEQDTVIFIMQKLNFKLSIHSQYNEDCNNKHLLIFVNQDEFPKVQILIDLKNCSYKYVYEIAYSGFSLVSCDYYNLEADMIRSICINFYEYVQRLQAKIIK